MGKCELLGGTFSAFIQVALGLIAVTGLWIKRVFETPKRPFDIWAADVTKQILGAGYAHVMNMGISWAIAKSLGDGADECSWYFINYVMDITVGTVINILLLRQLETIARKLKWKSLQKSGYYGPDHSWRIWAIQLWAWIMIVTLGKVFAGIAMYSFSPYLNIAGDWMFGPIQPYPELELTVVMVIVPCFLNFVQFWVQDTFLQGGRFSFRSSRRQRARRTEAETDAVDLVDADRDSSTVELGLSGPKSGLVVPAENGASVSASATGSGECGLENGPTGAIRRGIPSLGISPRKERPQDRDALLSNTNANTNTGTSSTNRYGVTLSLTGGKIRPKTPMGAPTRASSNGSLDSGIGGKGDGEGGLTLDGQEGEDRNGANGNGNSNRSANGAKPTIWSKVQSAVINTREAKGWHRIDSDQAQQDTRFHRQRSGSSSSNSIANNGSSGSLGVDTATLNVLHVNSDGIEGSSRRDSGRANDRGSGGGGGGSSGSGIGGGSGSVDLDREVGGGGSGVNSIDDMMIDDSTPNTTSRRDRRAGKRGIT